MITSYQKKELETLIRLVLPGAKTRKTLELYHVLDVLQASGETRFCIDTNYWLCELIPISIMFDQYQVRKIVKWDTGKRYLHLQSDDVQESLYNLILQK